MSITPLFSEMHEGFRDARHSSSLRRHQEARIAVIIRLLLMKLPARRPSARRRGANRCKETKHRRA